MAQLEVRTNFCQPDAQQGRSGWKPACTCGWTGNITFGSQYEADEVWAQAHLPTMAPAHDAAKDGIFVVLLNPETVDPDRPRVDPPAPWKAPLLPNRAPYGERPARML